MSTIQLSGLNTGIDTQKIINQLMNVKSQRLATYQVKQKDYENISGALTELRSQINSLKSAVTSISDADNLISFNTSSGDTDKLTISASSDANSGSHSVEIGQLATTDTWIQDNSTFEYKTDYVGGGQFMYSYNHQEITVTTEADETTIQDMINLINNDENNPGIVASLLYRDGYYHLMLSGQDMGGDYQITVNTSNTEVWQTESAFTNAGSDAAQSDLITSLDQFTGSFDEDESISISGKLHDGTSVSGSLNLTENSKLSHLIDEINDVFDGNATARLVNGKIRLTDHTCGTSQMELSLTYNDPGSDSTFDIPSISQYTQGGSEDANISSLDPSTFIETQSAQDSKIRIDGYPQAVAEVQTLVPDNPATGGTFTLTYGGEETDAIDYNATLEEIQSALEALSTVDSGDITVSGDSLDTDPVADGLVFTFADEAGNVDMIEFDFSGLTGTTQAGSSISETTQGEDNWISTSSNSITQVLPGITFNLHEVTDEDTPVEITVSRNVSMIKTKIKSMIGKYNTALSFLKEKTEYDADKEKMGILSRNVDISLIDSQLTTPFTGIASGFTNEVDNFTQASDIGITVDGHGYLELDESELDDAIDQDLMGVVKLVGASQTGNSSSDYIKFCNASTYTTAGTYDVRVGCDASGENRVAWIKTNSENWSQARQATFDGDVITCSTDFSDDDPEKGLQLAFTWDGNEHVYDNDNPTAGNPLETTVRVKQGFASELEDMLDTLLKADGRIDIAKDAAQSRIDSFQDKIQDEQDRLEKEENRLIVKYARLEKILSQLDQQYSALTMMMNS